MLWLGLFAVLPARADDALAKQHFDDGVAAASAHQWEEAVRSFDASLLERDKPTTRFNLILANRELSRPLDIVRHALIFLDAPESASHEDVREQARALLADALTKLAILDTRGLPSGVVLEIDGGAPALFHGGRVYVQAGMHHLEARLGDRAGESIELYLSAGQTMPWPRLGRSQPPPRSPSADSLPHKPAPTTHPPRSLRPRLPEADLTVLRLRTDMAWAMGGTGAALALAAVGCLWAAQYQGEKLAAGGPTKVGYPSASDQYLRVLNPIIPLALTGGALMAGAVVMGAHVTRRGSMAWSIASLVVGSAMLGLGAVLMVREPEPWIAGTPNDRPSREAGSLLTSGALPMLSYGVGFQVVRKRSSKAQLTGYAPLRVVW